jgi:hypothetical protein
MGFVRQCEQSRAAWAFTARERHSSTLVTSAPSTGPRCVDIPKRRDHYLRRTRRALQNQFVRTEYKQGRVFGRLVRAIYRPLGRAKQYRPLSQATTQPYIRGLSLRH